MSASESSGDVEVYDISCLPHHNTITASGKSHFSRVADGLAEFIDNSIQACRKAAPKRQIYISFFFTGSTRGFATISDNGCGMDQKCLTEYATYSLDQKTRGYTVVEEDNSFISKFGVGAKQAGFFLGGRIRVITKTAESPQVLEIVLDRDEYERRFRADEDVYHNQIKSRSVGDMSIAPIDEAANEVLMDAIRGHETANEQFTITVIRLHQDTVRALRSKENYVKDIADQLAEIYHFHLHPEHTPDKIIEMDKFKSTGDDAVLAPKKIRGGAEKPSATELDISFAAFFEGRVTFNMPLQEVQDPVQLCVDKAKAAFRFNIDIPDPSPFEAFSQENQLTQSVNRQLDGEHTGSGGRRHVVQGVVFYYPYENGRETRPTPGDKPLARRAGKRADSTSSSSKGASTSASAAAATSAAGSKRNGRKTSKGSSSSSSASATASAGAGARAKSSKGRIDLDDSDDEGVEVEVVDAEGGASTTGDVIDDYIYEISDDEEAAASAADRKIFETVSVFWQDRLVPTSTLQKLPFFPDARSKSKCDTDKLPENWRGRLKGYLFFDWHFRHISNNKLRIQVDPNIDDWLNDKSRAKQVVLTPSRVKEQFLQ